MNELYCTILFFTYSLFAQSCVHQEPQLPPSTKVEPTLAAPKANPIATPMVDTVFMRNAPKRITRKIRRDAQDQLLFAAYEDIIRYDGSSFSKLYKDLDSYDAFDVLEDTRGNTWIASTHFGLFKLRDSSLSPFTVEDGLAHARTMCLYEDGQGVLWIGTQAGISCYDGNTFRNYSTQDGLTSNDINTIVEGNEGKIWVGTRGSLCVYDPNIPEKNQGIVFREFVTHDHQSFANIWGIAEDHNGRLWLGGEQGLWVVEGTRTLKVGDLGTTGLIVDSKGNVWCTQLGSGLQRATFSRIDLDASGKESPRVMPLFSSGGMFFGLAEDTAGNIWVGTLQGVFAYDGQSIWFYKDNMAAGQGAVPFLQNTDN